MACLWSVGGAAAQEVVGDGWVNIHGLPPLDLNGLPPELAAQIRIPGAPEADADGASQEEAAPPPEVEPEVDAAAAQSERGGRTVEEIVRTARDDPNLLVVPEPPWPTTDEERAERRRIVETMYPPERGHGVEHDLDDPQPSAAPPLPEDAYLQRPRTARTSSTARPGTWDSESRARIVALRRP